MIVTHEKCFLCGKDSDFTIDDGAVLLREAVCNFCGASIRNSDTAKVVTSVFLNEGKALSECLNELSKLSILEASSAGPIHNLLAALPGYQCFEYFDGIEPGSCKNNIMCNDLQKLTYRDESFDLVITQDVFEHIEKPYEAFNEISRVLKMFGHHIFTIPLHEGRTSIDRKNLKKVYHGDPIRGEGALVYTDWGDDICKLTGPSMKTERVNGHVFYDGSSITDIDKTYTDYLSSEHIFYFKYNSIVFNSCKTKRGNIWNSLVRGIFRKI